MGQAQNTSRANPNTQMGKAQKSQVLKNQNLNLVKKQAITTTTTQLCASKRQTQKVTTVLWWNIFFFFFFTVEWWVWGSSTTIAKLSTLETIVSSSTIFEAFWAQVWWTFSTLIILVFWTLAIGFQVGELIGFTRPGILELWKWCFGQITNGNYKNASAIRWLIKWEWVLSL